MAIEPRILVHAEEVEYVKELARQIAQQLLTSSDVRDVVEDPAAFVDRLLAVLLAELGPAARRLADEAARYASEIGLQELDDAEIDDIADEAKRKFLAFALPALRDAADALVARIHDMIGAGVAFTSIHSAMTSPATQAALFAPFLGTTRRLVASWMQFVARDVNDAAIQGMQAAAATPDAAEFEDLTPKLTWIAVMDKNTCGEDDDIEEHYCRPRHAQARTLAEWSALGLPGSPVLECSMRSHRGASPCRCILVSAEHAATVAGPVVAAEAVKRGRARAVADARRAA